MNDMENLGLSQKGVQSRNKWRRRIKGATSQHRFTWKMAIKTECVCVCLLTTQIPQKQKEYQHCQQYMQSSFINSMQAN